MSVCLYDCLYEAKLDQYYPQLTSAGIINSEELSLLTMEDYAHYGIYKMDDRKRLFQLIQIIKRVRQANLNHDKSLNCLSPKKKSVTNGAILQRELSESLSLEMRRENMDLYGNINSKNNLRDSPQRVSEQLKTVHTPKHSKMLPVSRNSQKKTLSPKTLSKLEKSGGDLFVSQSRKKRDSKNKNSEVRQSVSDSELLEDSVLPKNSNSFVDISQLKKERFVGKIDHYNAGYNYGVPDENKLTPNKKNISKQNQLFNTPMSLRNEIHLRRSTVMPKIVVCVRKRPVSRREHQNKEVNVVEVDSQSSVLVNEVKTALNMTKFVQEHKFHFDEVFHENCSNEEVYSRTARPLLQTVFNKGKATCFAYGQTGAGKTHTMMGSDKVKGLYLLAAQDIFQLQQSGGLGWDITTWTSYFEIYCGNLYDLLNNRQRLHAREDAQHRVNIVGLKEVQVLSADSLLQIVEHGNKIRSKGCSGVNTTSSRSHAVLQIELKDPSKRPIGRLSFIDLAGSERACDTVDPDKLTRIEGAEINTSLLALKECIRALDQDQKHTPFRQSKLTQVLKDSFLGNSRTCMIANISPNIGSTEHTLNTLRYADRVKELRKEPQPRSGSTPKTKLKSHPPTPTTFSPGSTSTPMKTSKKLTTPKSPHSVTKHGSHVLNESSVKKDEAVRYCPTPHRREVINRDQAQVHSKRKHQRSVKSSPDTSREILNTPVSRGKEVSQTSCSTDKSKNHSIQSVALPVWQSIVTEEPKVRTPSNRNQAWDVKNDRYVLKSNYPRTDDGKVDDHDTTNGPEVEDKKEIYAKSKEKPQSSLVDDNWCVRNNSNKIKEVGSPSYRSVKREAKTGELLAGIEEALKNSVIRLTPEEKDKLYSARLEKNEEMIRNSKTEIASNGHDILLTSPIVLKQKSLMSLGEVVQSSFDSVSTDSLNRHPTKSMLHNPNANEGPLNMDNYRGIKVDHSGVYSETTSAGSLRNMVTSKKELDSKGQDSDQDIFKAGDLSSENLMEHSEKHHQPVRSNSFPTASNYRTLRMGTLSARKLDFAMEVLTKAMNPVKKDSVKMTTFAEQRIKSSLFKSFSTLSETTETSHLNASNENSTGVISDDLQRQSDMKNSSSLRPSEKKSVVEKRIVNATDVNENLQLENKFVKSVPFPGLKTNDRKLTPHKKHPPMYQSTPVIKECIPKSSYQHFMEKKSVVVKEKGELSNGTRFTKQMESAYDYSGSDEAVRMQVTGIKQDMSNITEDSTRTLMPPDNELYKQESYNGSNFHQPEIVKEAAKESTTPRKHLRSKSAIEKAQNLLYLTHSQQLLEIKSLCDREMDLLNEVKIGKTDFLEYLTLTCMLQETKLQRIQTFKDQLETFHSFSSPEISPAASTNSSIF